MKNNGEITKYVFVVIREALCLRVSKRGQSDSLIHVPAQAEDMDQTEQESDDQAGTRCPICIAPFNNINPIAVYACGHTFHESCLKSSLTQSMKCPTCRAIPPNINSDRIECLRCITDGTEGDTIVMSRRCNHLHFSTCQRSHLSTLDAEYPPSIEGYNNIISARDIMGCHACLMQTPMDFETSTIIHFVAYESGMTDYIDLGTNDIPVLPIPVPLMAPRPAGVDRQDRSDPILVPLMVPRPADVAPPIAVTVHSPPLSGSNNIPIASRDRRVSFARQDRRDPDSDPPPRAPAPSPRSQSRDRRSHRDRDRQLRRQRSRS